MSQFRWLPFLFAACISGCTSSPAKPPGPTAENAKVEADLAFTTLTKNAYLALQIQTAPAKVELVQERLTLTGWIMAKPGHEVVLTAPAAGYVKVGTGQNFPIAGDNVKPRQVLFTIEPVLSPAERIQVDALKRSIEGDKKKAQTTLHAAKKDHERIENLHAQKLKSDQELELAIKAHQHAKEELDAADDKLKLFQLASIPVRAPQAATVLAAPVSAGQFVQASSPLVTLIDLSPAWIRVPVPEFDLPLIDIKASVEITFKNANHQQTEKPALFRAKATGRVAQVDPVRHTAELWYELDATKEAGRFVKDQMVTARIPIGRKDKAAVVPYSALIFDTHGHTWIYLERTTDKDAKHRFERHPVELVTSDEERVVIRANLKGGENVVTNGAGKLFSRDFHKTPIPEDD